MTLNDTSGTLLILATLSLTACDKAPNTEDTQSNDYGIEQTIVQVPQSNQHEMTETNETSHADAENLNSSTESLATNQSDKHMTMLPLSEYHDVNSSSDNAWLTPLFIAQSTRVFTDEEKLNLMSPEYYNEADVFKKKELAQTLLPQIEQQIAQYAGDYRVKAPLVRENGVFYQQQEQLNLSKNYITSRFAIGPYDFDDKSFSMNTCDNFNFGVVNEQKITIQQIGTDGIREPELRKLTPVAVEDCKLEVTDEQLARKIEQARSANNIFVRGSTYFYLKGADNYLVAYPEFAQLSFYDRTTGEDLIDKELHFNVGVDAG